MFKKKTVLILGAGASVPYHYPTGAELVEEVLKRAEKRLINKDLWKHRWKPYDYTVSSPEEENLKTFINNIRKYKPINIDYFLHQVYGGGSKEHKQLIQLGHELIAEVILNCEKKIDDKGNFTRPIKDQDGKPVKDKNGNNSYEDNWYRYLRHDLISGGVLEGEQDENGLTEALKESLKKIQIITFNYDVSLEYFLYESFKILNEKCAQAVLEKLNVLHVYGQIRNNFQKEIIDNNSEEPLEPLEPLSDYGNWHNIDSKLKQNQPNIINSDQWADAKKEITELDKALKIAAPHIRGVGEDKSRDKKVTAKAEEMLKDAETLAFFGFGFDENNLEMLGFKANAQPMDWNYRYNAPRLKTNQEKDIHPKILYTNYGDRGKVTNAIHRMFQIEKYPLTILHKSPGNASVAKALADDFDLL